MLTRLLDNWPYKLAAVIISVLLYFYVSAQLNPQVTKDFPLVVVHVPEGLYKKDATPTVTLQLSGSAGALDGLRETDIMATVDASDAHAGVNRNLPINISVVPEYRDRVSVEAKQPSVAVVTMEKLDTARRPVHVIFTHAAGSGYEFGTPTVAPMAVKVVAPQSVIATIKDVVVDVDSRLDEGKWPDTEPIDRMIEIEPRDVDGRRIVGAVVVPTEARVTIPTVRVASVKVVPVAPAIIGRPVSPMIVSGVLVDPPSATLTGPADILARTNVVMTAPIDVSGATADLSRLTSLQAPTGLTITSAPKVNVTIQVSKRETGQPVGASSAPPAVKGVGTQ